LLLIDIIFPNVDEKPQRRGDEKVRKREEERRDHFFQVNPKPLPSSLTSVNFDY